MPLFMDTHRDVTDLTVDAVEAHGLVADDIVEVHEGH